MGGLPLNSKVFKKAGVTAGGTIQLEPRLHDVEFIQGITTASVTTFLAAGTDYTLTGNGGLLTCVTDQSAKTLLIFGNR